MKRRFFVCSVGEPGKGYDEENLKRCKDNNGHFMHCDTKHKGVFDSISMHDIAFLRYSNGCLIAYGEVTRTDTSDNDMLGEWNYAIYVDKWYYHNDSNIKKGISRYGVQEATVAGDQFATVKEIKADFGIQKMEEIKESNLLITVKSEQNMDKDIIENIELVLSNHNLILTGAPGTGKTYLAKQIAAQMILGKEFDEKIASNEEKTKMKEQFDFVQFHPSFDYTDFVEGLRPIEDDNGNVSFRREDGIFMKFCRRALNAYRKAEEKKEEAPKYVFVIDEINRGELSKIFGELFFCIDPGYRGEKGKVKTQYYNLWKNDLDANLRNYEGSEFFFIPENVYIIGTMNDIDRSVESMDFAMRRRFAFIEVLASDRMDMIKECDKLSPFYDTIKQRMTNLNLCILTIQGLTTAYQIGAAYFLKLKNYIENGEPNWVCLWTNHLYGLLFEYLRGLPNAHDDLEKLRRAYYLNDIYKEKEGKVTQVEANNG